MQRDDGSVLLRRQLSECSIAAERHTAAAAALHLAALEESTEQPPRSGWAVVAGRERSVAEPALDPNPPRLWFDLSEFGADPTGREDCSAALSAALDAASRAGGGATIFVPAGSYRIACPVLDPVPDPETPATVAGAPLSAAVHLIGEGLHHSELLWEAVGWQLLAAPAGGAGAREHWQRAKHDESNFPFALACHGLVLVHLSVCGTASASNCSGAQQEVHAARRHRVDLLNAEHEADSQCTASQRTRPALMRYDVRLQHAQISGFRSDEFDRSTAVSVMTDDKSQPCQLLHAKQRDQSMPQNLKRGCAVCSHTARARTARMLLRAYEGWLAGADATATGDLAGAAAEFGEAATAAAAAGESIEAAVLYSNQAECMIRLGEYTGAALALQGALQHWPDHGDSKRRLKYVADVQAQTVSAAGGSCCELDLKFFGFERTGAKALSHLAGDLHGAAAELEAALAFGSPRAVWCHADSRTPRETRLGGSSALNVAVPNGVAGDTNELTIFQEIDLMCENRQLWCEVKAWTSLNTDQEDIGSERIHSSSSGATRWTGLVAQLRRYRDAAESYTVAHALLTQPKVAAIVQGPPGASKAAVAALRAEGFGCLTLHCHTRPCTSYGSETASRTAAADVLADLRSLQPQPLQHEQATAPPLSPVRGQVAVEPAIATTRRSDSSRCLRWAEDSSAATPGLFDAAAMLNNASLGGEVTCHGTTTTCGGGGASCEANNNKQAAATTNTNDAKSLKRQVLNLDQGMLAVLVANIWELTTDDMRESGAKFLRLFSGETVFETPEGLLATLRPLYRLLTSPRFALVACESSVSSFEHFLALRGDDVEQKRWAILRQSDRLQILADVPLPSVLKPIVVDKCRGAVALGLSLGGALTLIDDILTVRRLRFHPDTRISLLLTPEGKLRASYLGLGVKGRPTTLQCVGVCGRLRHSSEFSYNARRAASQVQLVWTSDDTKCSSAGAEGTPDAQTTQGSRNDAEDVGRVICYGCAAAEDAVSVLVSRVFHLPAVWAHLVRKARDRWSVETRPWCQRRWILGRLIQNGQLEYQRLLRSAVSQDKICDTSCVNTREVWSKACDAALVELCGVQVSPVKFQSDIASEVDTRMPVSTAQSQTNSRNAELFAEMSDWLQDAALLPRAPTARYSKQDEEEVDLGLGSALMGQDDY